MTRQGLSDGSRLRRFTRILLATFAVFCGAAYGWGGIDFAAGVALGCLVVGTNYTLTVFVVRRALRADSLKGQVLFAFALKFGLTIVALYLAILHFGVEPRSIVLGVTSLVVASLVLVLSYPQRLWKTSASAAARRLSGRFRP